MASKMDIRHVTAGRTWTVEPNQDGSMRYDPELLKLSAMLRIADALEAIEKKIPAKGTQRKIIKQTIADVFGPILESANG